MALGIYSGKDAYVNNVSCVQSWQATPAVAATRYTSSCSSGGSNVAPGVQNWTGQMAGIGVYPNAVLPGVAPFTFQGVINATAGQGDLKSLNGTIYIEQLTIEFNKESAAPVSWQATFGFDGTPTESSTSAFDSTDPVLDIFSDTLDIQIGESATSIATASCAIRTAQLVLRRQMSTYVKDGTTYRKPGHLECDVSFGVFCPTLANSSYATNAMQELRLAIGDAYWGIRKVRFLGKSGLQVDRNSNNVLGYTVNAQWNYKDDDGAGWITYYDGTDPNDFIGDSTP